MLKNTALRLAGAGAILMAVYHGTVGDTAITAMPLSAADMSFVRSTFQLGSMGWLVGGILLIAAAGFATQKARNWIVGVYAVVYGFPAAGAFLMTGGKPDISWIGLSLVVVLALYGRKIGLPQPAAVTALAS